MEKWRGGGRLAPGRLVGDVEGAVAIVVDDLISTGSTLAHAARACRAAGARRVYAAAAHGLFVRGAAEALAAPEIDRIVVTDSVPPFRLPPGPARDKLTVLPAAPLFAEAIRLLHEGGSLVELLEA